MISIIGAGPAGNYLAYLLAKHGWKTEVYEEHKEIGKPVQCTGIVSSHITNFFGEKELKKFVVNRIKKAKIISPNNDFVEVNLKKENLIVDRAKFDKYLAEKAKKAGAKYYLDCGFVGIKGKNLLFKKNKRTIKKKTDILVGADGPLSRVAKSTGLFSKREFFIGVQAEAKLKNDNAVEFYPLKKGIAWVVPVNKDFVRIGVAAKEKTSKEFQRLLKKKLGEEFKKKARKYNAGLIPVYNPKTKTQSRSRRTFLIGDAATMVKATTLGGIIQGLEAAGALAGSIMEKKDYEKLWKKRIGKELWLSLKMRNIMDKFTEKDYNELIRIFRKENNRKILESEERDFPSRFITKLMLQEPNLLKFVRFLI